MSSTELLQMQYALQVANDTNAELMRRLDLLMSAQSKPLASDAPISPTYYVKHPDGTYSAVEPQPAALAEECSHDGPRYACWMEDGFEVEFCKECHKAVAIDGKLISAAAPPQAEPQKAFCDASSRLCPCRRTGDTTGCEHAQADELPELPEPAEQFQAYNGPDEDGLVDLFTAAQMQEYARAAIAAKGSAA